MQIIRFIVNWIFIILIPIWILPLGIIVFINALLKGELDGPYINGEKWLWE